MLHPGQLGRQHVIRLDQRRDLLILADQPLACSLMRRSCSATSAISSSRDILSGAGTSRSHRTQVDQATTDTPESPTAATSTSTRAAQRLNVFLSTTYRKDRVLGDAETQMPAHRQDDHVRWESEPGECGPRRAGNADAAASWHGASVCLIGVDALDATAPIGLGLGIASVVGGFGLAAYLASHAAAFSVTVVPAPVRNAAR
jgi:hypothetical protein